MSAKEKFLLIWVLVVVVVAFAMHHAWSCTVMVLDHVLASGLLTVPAISKVVFGIYTGMCGCLLS